MCVRTVRSKKLGKVDKDINVLIIELVAIIEVFIREDSLVLCIVKE